MARKTIASTIADVLSRADTPLTLEEIYDQIRSGQLYEFRTADPLAVVRHQLYRHTEGNDHKCAAKSKLFRRSEDRRFTLITR